MALSSSQKMTSAEVGILFSNSQKKYIKDNLASVKSNTVIFYKINDKKLYFSTNSWVAKWYGYNSVELSNITTIDENGAIETGVFHRSGVDLDGNYKVIKTSKLYEENGNVNTQAFNNSSILDQLKNFVFTHIKKGATQISKILFGDEVITEKPLDTTQNKTAGAGYSSGQLKWNGDYSISKIKTIKANGNIQLSGGDSWLRLYVSLSDGTVINREWGNGSINKTVEGTTNSGIHYTMKVEQYNVIYTFDDYVIPTDIYMETYTKFGTWRSEGFNINLYVTGYTIEKSVTEISKVTLGTTLIYDK